MKNMLASIDIGAHSARLLIVEVDKHSGTYETIEDLEIPVPLGADVFKSGCISNKSVLMLCEIMKKFKLKMEEYRISEYCAIATSAVREAENADIFLERVKFLSGIDVRIFTGTDEARLGYLAVQSVIPSNFPFDEQTLLLADIGTGACQVSLFDHGIMRFTETIKLGTLRAIEEFSDTSSATMRMEQLEPVIDYAFSELEYLSGKMNCDGLIVTGASSRTMLAMRKQRIKRGVFELKIEEFKQLREIAATHTVETLGRDFNIKSDLAEAVLPCCMMISNLLKLTGAKTIYAPTISTKYALIEDFINSSIHRRDPFEPQIFGSASQIAERYGSDMRLIAATVILAEKLFEKLQPLHGMGHAELKMLKVASLLYKTGLFLNNQAYHKHSHYIILNTEIPGISLTERRIIAMVARYHRKSLPKPQHLDYMAIPVEQRAVINKLSAILRLACGLAVTCKPDERMTVKLSSNLVTIRMGGMGRSAALDYIDTDMFNYAFASKLIFV